MLTRTIELIEREERSRLLRATGIWVAIGLLIDVALIWVVWRLLA